jgi:hypothetical protein
MKRTPGPLVIGAVWVFAIVGITQGTLFGQSGSTVELPLFRPRTDPMATRDADAVRERLKSLSDSRGPINPLADYVKPKVSVEPKAANASSRVQDDEESRRIPSLDPEAQRRLKAQPPSVSASERHIIGLLPPPMIMSNPDSVVTRTWQDDGFRPLSSVTLASAPVVIGPAPTFGPGPIVGPAPIVIQSNYQVGDPASMIPPSLGPPSLGPPSTGLPTYSAPPPGLPPMNAPAMNAPAMGVPMSGAPPIGAPATISPPTGGFGGMPGSVPMVGAPGSNVMPAPPSYIVPGPSNTFAPATTPPAPYAAPTPTYSRSGGTVNSLPFVSSPPQARDARWMVSPDVYRRMEGGVCTTPSAPAYGAPMAGTGTGSPFFYAPPTAMPMPTPRTASRHSWLHPFRR